MALYFSSEPDCNPLQRKRVLPVLRSFPIGVLLIYILAVNKETFSIYLLNKLYPRITHLEMSSRTSLPWQPLSKWKDPNSIEVHFSGLLNWKEFCLAGCTFNVSLYSKWTLWVLHLPKQTIDQSIIYSKAKDTVSSEKNLVNLFTNKQLRGGRFLSETSLPRSTWLPSILLQINITLLDDSRSNEIFSPFFSILLDSCEEAIHQ